jgi:hypothetical protein
MDRDFSFTLLPDISTGTHIQWVKWLEHTANHSWSIGVGEHVLMWCVTCTSLMHFHDIGSARGFLHHLVTTVSDVAEKYAASIKHPLELVHLPCR